MWCGRGGIKSGLLTRLLGSLTLSFSLGLGLRVYEAGGLCLSKQGFSVLWSYFLWGFVKFVFWFGGDVWGFGSRVMSF